MAAPIDQRTAEHNANLTSSHITHSDLNPLSLFVMHSLTQRASRTHFLAH